MFGGAVTLAAAVILWQAFKHLDLKIERLGDRLDDKIDRLEDKIDKKFDDQRIYFDQKFDQLMAAVAEVSRLVAGHDAQIKAQEKQLDRLSTAVFAPPRFGAPSRHQEGAHQEEAHAPEPAAPAEGAIAPSESIASSAGGPEPAAPAEVVASSTGGPEPTPPPAAIAPA